MFTPLIPITDEFEDYNETDKEDSLSDPPETPTIVHQEDESKPNDDDEEDESGPDATIKDEKPEENEADRNDQLAETQAEEHLMTHGHQEDFLLMPIPQTVINRHRDIFLRTSSWVRPSVLRFFINTANSTKFNYWPVGLAFQY